MRSVTLTAVLAAAVLAAVAVPGQVAAQGGPAPLRFGSYVPGIVFSPVQALPRSPVTQRAACFQPATKAASPAAAEVAAAGWGVTGEATVGRFQTVSFVAGASDGTSGSCLLSQGNLAVFDGTRLLAIAYATPTSKMTIGHVEQVAPRVVRLWDGNYLSQPIADIRPSNGFSVGGGTLAVLPLASEQLFCGGRAVVPNVYGMPIDVARRLVGIGKWSPVPSKRGGDDFVDGRVSDLVRRGVPEVDSCSGTGFGYCSFHYRGPAGELQVITAGEGDFPGVTDYQVDCAK